MPHLPYNGQDQLSSSRHLELGDCFFAAMRADFGHSTPTGLKLKVFGAKIPCAMEFLTGIETLTTTPVVAARSFRILVSVMSLAIFTGTLIEMARFQYGTLGLNRSLSEVFNQRLLYLPSVPG